MIAKKKILSSMDFVLPIPQFLNSQWEDPAEETEGSGTDQEDCHSMKGK
jgi:hypothetical protein